MKGRFVLPRRLGPPGVNFVICCAHFCSHRLLDKTVKSVCGGLEVDSITVGMSVLG